MMNKEFWVQVYDILVEECGLSLREVDKHIFLHKAGKFTEWRFSGNLGFGGKLWNNDGKLYVNCYPEDLTIEREEMIVAANERLEELVSSYSNLC
jgi:hypothetical protein